LSTWVSVIFRADLSQTCPDLSDYHFIHPLTHYYSGPGTETISATGMGTICNMGKQR
jgi:hypothetical protein